MNPEPPPIADPHDTAPLPIATAPRTSKTALFGLSHVVLGMPTMLAGAAFAAIYAADKMKHGLRDDDLVNVPGAALFVFFVCGLGFILIRHGLRIWKHGPPIPAQRARKSQLAYSMLIAFLTVVAAIITAFTTGLIK